MERRGGIRSWFVEPYLQIRLGLIFLVLNLVFAIIFCGVVGYFFLDVYQVLAGYFSFTSVESSQVLIKLQMPIMVAFGLVLAFVLATILVSVRYTHSIYGPLISVHSFLDNILSSKKVKPLELRSGDQLEGLVDRLNRLSVMLDSGQLKDPCLASVNNFLDDLNAGRRPQPLSIPDGNPLAPIVEKLNLLAGLQVKSS